MIDIDIEKAIEKIEKKETNNNKLIPYEDMKDSVKRVIEASTVNPSGVALTKSQIDNITKKVSYLIKGSGSNIVMGCAGIACPTSRTCPLLNVKGIDEDGNPTKINIAPVGELCPIENEIYNNLKREYTEAVCNMLGREEYELNKVYRTGIIELIECELMEMRAQGYIQKSGLFERAPAMVTKEGDVIEDMRPSIAMDIKDRVKKRKDKIMQQLMITEEMDVRYRKKGKNEDLAAKAKGFEMILEMLTTMKTKNKVAQALDVANAEFTVVEDE